ncbi:MAG: hypothetical protein Q7K57_26440 [Burkholderiaceae bacterium]|nr:hypothetical protein [Burkholderiaceae bacterium]
MSHTRDIDAKAAGFGSGKINEQAKRVTNKAAVELVLAVHEGRASISAAATRLSHYLARMSYMSKTDPIQEILENLTQTT